MLETFVMAHLSKATTRIYFTPFSLMSNVLRVFLCRSSNIFIWSYCCMSCFIYLDWMKFFLLADWSSLDIGKLVFLSLICWRYHKSRNYLDTSVMNSIRPAFLVLLAISRIEQRDSKLQPLGRQEEEEMVVVSSDLFLFFSYGLINKPVPMCIPMYVHI